ncbi:anti-sigma factor [Leucobacter sp. W1153]|uniref:anti-sigma factor n=1 Tax=unclassified Leucobacter TaxID=2621730 RepID=UPI003F3E7A31
MTKQEFSDLAAAFALGGLNAEERATFERMLAMHPEWADAVDADLRTVMALAASVPEEAPRAQVKESLLSRLDALIEAGEPPSALRESQVHPVVSAVDHSTPSGGASTALPQVTPTPLPDLPNDGEDELPRRRRFGTRILATLAVVALIAGVGSGLFSALQPERPAGIVALEQIASAADAQSASTRVASGGEAALTWSAGQGKAVLVTAGLNPAPSGHTYELWFVRGEEKIPAGTFDPNSQGEAAVLVSGEMAEGDVIAVTVEVTGGSPNGLPSDQLVFAIPTSPAGQAT